MHRVPDRLLAVGAGPVGIEFATAFAALGVEVTVSDLLDRILTAMDGEIGAAMHPSWSGWELAPDSGWEPTGSTGWATI